MAENSFLSRKLQKKQEVALTGLLFKLQLMTTSIVELGAESGDSLFGHYIDHTHLSRLGHQLLWVPSTAGITQSIVNLQPLTYILLIIVF